MKVTILPRMAINLKISPVQPPHSALRTAVKPFVYLLLIMASTETQLYSVLVILLKTILKLWNQVNYCILKQRACSHRLTPG